MTEQLRTFSFGGGVQSTAALVLAAEGVLDFRTFLFANTGDDSEHPDTLEYVHNVSMPYAKEHGLEIIEVKRVKKDGSSPTLKEAAEAGRLVLPLHLDRTGAPAARSCTQDWKIKVIQRWQREHGASGENQAITGIGISTDEIQRARSPVDPRWPMQYRVYPLIDNNIDRAECVNIIGRSGLPIPPKSSCWFCPFKRPSEWRAMRVERPEIFAKVVALEERINEKYHERYPDRGDLHFSPQLTPLRDIYSESAQLSLFGDDAGNGSDCETGFCMT